MNNSVLTNLSLEKIYKIISVKFGVDLSQKQLLYLINTQSEELKSDLLKDRIDPASLDQLVEIVSERITGMHYPTQHSTPYYKEYYKKKLNESKDSYFGSF